MTHARKTWLRGALGIALLLGVLMLADPARVLAQLRDAHPLWLLGGLMAAIASNVVSALRWRVLARWLGVQISVRDALRWYMQAIGLNALLPGAVLGGDVYRAVALRRTGQDMAASSWSVLLDRVSGLWMLCAIGALGAAACASVLAPWLRLPTSAFAALMAVGCVLWLALPWTLPQLLQRVSSNARWLRPLRAAAARPDFSRQLLWQALCSAAVQVLSAAALAAGALALGLAQPPIVWAWAIAPIFLMAALPVSVGGWGTREAAAVAALAPFAVSASAAVSAGLVYGLYQLAQGALGALTFGLPRQPASETA